MLDSFVGGFAKDDSRPELQFCSELGFFRGSRLIVDGSVSMPSSTCALLNSNSLQSNSPSDITDSSSDRVDCEGEGLCLGRCKDFPAFDAVFGA
jgi:hypothetical protein